MENIEKLISLETSRARIYSRLAEAYRLPENNLSRALDDIESALLYLDSGVRKDATLLRQAYETIRVPGNLKKIIPAFS